MLGIVLDRSLPTIIRIEASALPVSPGVMVLLAIGARCGREVTASSRHQALLPAKLLGDGRVTAFNVAGFGAAPAAWVKVRAARRSRYAFSRSALVSGALTGKQARSQRWNRAFGRFSTQDQKWTARGVPVAR